MNLIEYLTATKKYDNILLEDKERGLLNIG